MRAFAATFCISTSNDHAPDKAPWCELCLVHLWVTIKKQSKMEDSLSLYFLIIF